MRLINYYGDLRPGIEYKQIGEGYDFVILKGKHGIINVPNNLIDKSIVEEDYFMEREEDFGDYSNY